MPSGVSNARPFTPQHDVDDQERLAHDLVLSIGPGPGATGRLVTDVVEDSYDLVVEQLPRRDRPGAG
ncbi:hypothetical protein [Nonomuraea sp. NPDC001699]